MSAAMPARIGFSRARGLGGLVSQLICWATRSPCSHVWLLISDPTLGCEMVLEASEHGLVPVSLAEWLRHNRPVALYLPRQSIDAAIPAFDRYNVGRAYDFAGLAGMLWVELGRRLGREWRNPWDTPALFCSEAVASVMAGAGYPGVEQHLASATDPGDLLRLLAGDGSTLLPLPGATPAESSAGVH